jgi:PAS domain-containing protein
VLSWWERSEGALHGGRSPLARVLATGAASDSDMIRIECVDGTTKNLLESASPLRGLDGSIAGAVIVLHDVTERRKLEAEFEARIAQLVSLGVELGQSAGSAQAGAHG